MEYSPKLTVISVLLNIDLLKVMHFNDLCLLFTGFTELYRSTVYIGIWMEFYGMLYL